MQEEMENKMSEENKKTNEDLEGMNPAHMITGGPPHIMATSHL